MTVAGWLAKCHNRPTSETSCIEMVSADDSVVACLTMLSFGKIKTNACVSCYIYFQWGQKVRKYFKFHGENGETIWPN